MSPSPQVRRNGLLDIIHVIMSDRRETMRYNANELAISRGRFDVAIHNAFQMPKVLHCWVPKLFKLNVNGVSTIHRWKSLVFSRQIQIVSRRIPDGRWSMGQPLPTKHERSILSVEKPRLFSAKKKPITVKWTGSWSSRFARVSPVGFSELGPSITRTY